MCKNIFYFKIPAVIVFFALLTGSSAKATTDNAASVYRPGIEVIKSLKGSNYTEYIQIVYVDPNEKNKLMVLIKPNYWFMLTQKEKKDILEKVSAKWQELYTRLDSDDEIKPEACFANI